MSRARPPVDDEDLKTEIFDGGPKTTADPAPAATGAKRPKQTMPPPVPKAPRVPPGAPKPAESGPMRAISMKTPAELAKEAPEPKNIRPQIPQVKLRSIAEASRITPSRGMGNLAPPRDPHEARKQRLWSNTFWASIAVIIASLVALAIWLIAGRK